MASFKDLVGKRISKTVKFMGDDVTISKLSVSEVMGIQAQAKDIGSDESKGLSVLKTVIRSGTIGAEELDDEAFDGFPMDELSKLSNEIMKFSGLDGDKAGKSQS